MCFKRARLAGYPYKQYVICSKYSAMMSRWISKYGVRRRGTHTSNAYNSKLPWSLVHQPRLPKYSCAVKNTMIDFGIVSSVSSSVPVSLFWLSVDIFRFEFSVKSSSRCKTWCKITHGYLVSIGCNGLLFLSNEASNWLDRIRTMLWMRRE